MGKNVAVIVRTSPFNTLKSVEAFRMGVGLTLEGNHVDILLMEEGVWNAIPASSRKIERPDPDQFIQSLEICGIGAYVDTERLPAVFHPKIREGIRGKTKKELVQMIKTAEVVISY
ncbi:MAG: DsrE family protein [Nitrospirae bacterium]|nr:DsrE family protein [Nitrospirota bacterium]MBI3352696.1 DsrE family protein [Nitrospirota bacterium]